MGGKKRDYIALSRMVKQSINDAVTEEVGKRFMSVLGEIDNTSTTAVEDTARALKYYATAKCMMIRMRDEMRELNSYMATLDSLPEDRRKMKKATKLYEAKQKRYEHLEAESYKIETWISDIDYAVSRLEDENQRKWVIGKYMLEKTDAEMKSSKPGVSGRAIGTSEGASCVSQALNTLKYYMFPMKALREDVLNVKRREKFSKK